MIPRSLSPSPCRPFAVSLEWIVHVLYKERVLDYYEHKAWRLKCTAPFSVSSCGIYGFSVGVGGGCSVSTFAASFSTSNLDQPSKSYDFILSALASVSEGCDGVVSLGSLNVTLRTGGRGLSS